MTILHIDSSINGENSDKNVTVDLSAFGKRKATLITDGAEPLAFRTENLSITKNAELGMKPNGGFVVVLE